MLRVLRNVHENEEEKEKNKKMSLPIRKSKTCMNDIEKIMVDTRGALGVSACQSYASAPLELGRHSADVWLLYSLFCVSAALFL